MKVRIYITLKKGVLDTQGKTIEHSLVKHLDFHQISKVRQGKLVEMEIEERNESKVEKIVAEICDKLLVNQVIEEYSFEIAD